jgi:hypothetical protein
MFVYFFVCLSYVFYHEDCLFTGKKIIGEQEKGRKKFIGWQLLAGDKQKAIVWEYKYFCFKRQIFLLHKENIFGS